MTDFETLVENKLVELKRDDIAKLWKEIYQAYDEGGPDSVEALVLGHLDELKKDVRKQAKEIKVTIPQKAKRRRR